MPLFPTLKTWFMINESTFQQLQGQFLPLNMTHNVSPKFAHHAALSRSKEITQFLNMEADTISFGVLLHDYDSITGKAEETYDQLQEWARPDSKSNNHPPVLTFWIGSGWFTKSVIITGVSNAVFSKINIIGTVTEIRCTINLREYQEFSLEAKSIFETRYHRARVRDYYELLAYYEYKNSMLGDIIRKRHPSKPNIQKGDIIKLPSIEAIRREKAMQSSVVLATAYGKKSTPQRERRREIFDNRNVDYVSHIISEN